MSRNLSNRQHQTGKTITTKSAYGSHSDMIVDASDYELEINEAEVLLKDPDENFFYVTKKNRLDNGLADPARYGSKKLYLEKVEKVEEV